MKQLKVHTSFKIYEPIFVCLRYVYVCIYIFVFGMFFKIFSFEFFFFFFQHYSPLWHIIFAYSYFNFQLLNVRLPDGAA